MSHSDLELDWPQPQEFPSLQAEEVHVWAVPLQASNVPHGSLAATELERASTFALDKPRQAFVVTRVALRSLLGNYLNLPPRDVPIAFGLNGKPQLAAGELHFNLAHSGDLALIAITRHGAVGVDIEQLRPLPSALQLAARNFHPLELAAVRAASDAERSNVFLRCWTRKEAVIKAIGVGIGHPLHTFDVLAADVVELTAATGATTCHLHNLAPSAAYVAALATTDRNLTPLAFTYST